MSKKIKVDQLTNEIISCLEDFNNVTEEACERGVLTTAEEAVKMLRSAHPSGSEQWGSWGKYNSGWTKRKEKSRNKKGIYALIHNKDHYQLTHLLEKGHAKRNGGRTRAFPHIAPVEQKSELLLLENIRKRI